MFGVPFLASVSRRRFESRVARLTEGSIGPGPLRDALLHELVTDRGYVRYDATVLPSAGFGVVVERPAPVGTLVLLPMLAFEREEDLSVIASTRRAMASLRTSRPRTLVIVGGGSSFAGTARRSAGRNAIHVNDRGGVTESLRLGDSVPAIVVRDAVERVAKRMADGELFQLDEASALDLTRENAEFREENDREGLSAGFAPVTTSILVAMAACFVVGVFFDRDVLRGEGLAVAVLHRMGALERNAVLHGEWQRLLSSSFLHYGLMHIAMNGWAQWSLGRPIEYLLGSSRFLLLWVISALGAAIASMAWSGDTVSAGASGAIFGLLGAFSVFVFLRRDVLPQPVPKALKNGVIFTLFLNGLISFVPNIDVAAHAGGALTGALLALPRGILRRRSFGAPTSNRFVFLAPVALATVVVGWTSVRHAPWSATELPSAEFGVTRVDELALSLPWPTGFPRVRELEKDGRTIFRGAPGPSSPYELEVRVSGPPGSQQEAKNALEAQHRAHDAKGEKDPEGDKDKGQTASVDEGLWVYTWLTTLPSNRVVEISFTLPGRVRKDAELWGKRYVEQLETLNASDE